MNDMSPRQCSDIVAYKSAVNKTIGGVNYFTFFLAKKCYSQRKSWHAGSPEKNKNQTLKDASQKRF